MKNKRVFEVKDVLQSLSYIVNINVLLNNLNFKLRDKLYGNNQDKRYRYFEVSFHPSGDILLILVGVSNGYTRENVIIGRLRPNLNNLKYTLIVEKDAESFNFDNLADIANKYIDLIKDCIINVNDKNEMLNIRKIVEHGYLYILLNNLINNLLNRISDTIYDSNDTFDLFGVYLDTLFKEDKILITAKNRRLTFNADFMCSFNITFTCTPVLKNPMEYIVEFRDNESVSTRPTMEEKARTAISIKNILDKFIKSIDKCLDGDSPTLVLIGNNIDEDEPNRWYGF